MFGGFHLFVRGVSDGKDMWREVPQLSAHVSLDRLRVVDSQILVRIDCHQDGARVGLGMRSEERRHIQAQT